MKPPMPYAGGKSNIAETIVSLMPPHETYVEPFGGALSVFLAKYPSTVEVVNDLDSEIATFWRVLRTRSKELERICAFTPHSREEYMAARAPGQGGDDLTVAWRVWVRLTQGRGSRSNGTSGWRYTHGGNRMALSAYLRSYVRRIPPCAARLLLTSIEHRPALDVIHTYDRDDSLFYVDPPYIQNTRYGSIYSCEMGRDEDHIELLNTLTSCRGKVILSGYRTALYDGLLSGWTRVDIPSVVMTGELRTESVWLNYPIPSPTLFDMVE